MVLHVLKTPLADLKDRAQLLRLKLGLKREGTNMRDMVSQGLAEIEDSIEQTEIFVQELLTAQDIETTMLSLHRRPCDLVELCRQVLEEFAASTGRALRCASLPAPIQVEVDEKQMARPIISVFSIAYKSSPQGSAITVELQQIGQKAIITVSYRGSFPEVGMQFYLSRKIVEQHGGRLEVHRAPENETRYLILLPRRIDPTAEPTDTVRHTRDTQTLWTIAT